MRRIFLLSVTVWLALSALSVHAAVSITLGESVVALNGPWKFHTGDDPRWAAEGYDDSAWETFDLTPLPGSHDGDVGLKNYVPGWVARGHRGYTGLAWYRMAIHLNDTGENTLYLVGPPMSIMATRFFSMDICWAQVLILPTTRRRWSVFSHGCLRCRAHGGRKILRV
jgi:hypothetical protein